MRFVRGRTLSEAIRAYHITHTEGRAGPLELQGLLYAFIGVCNAVAYAHSRGVIHRDLKGQNIVLGAFGEVMVLDWGLAKVVGRPDSAGEGPAAPAGPPAAAGAPPVTLGGGASRDATLQGQIMGTPAYMPPEQAEGRIDRVDHL